MAPNAVERVACFTTVRPCKARNCPAFKSPGLFVFFICFYWVAKPGVICMISEYTQMKPACSLSAHLTYQQPRAPPGQVCQRESSYRSGSVNLSFACESSHPDTTFVQLDRQICAVQVECICVSMVHKAHLNKNCCSTHALFSESSAR